MDWAIFWTVFGGAFGGAVVGALATFFITRMNHRHERRKWLLEEKLKAYANYSATTYGFLAEISPKMAVTEYKSGMYASLGKLRLLADDDLSDRARLILNSLTGLAKLKKANSPSYSTERKEVQKELAALHDDMKKDITKKAKSRRSTKRTS